MTEHTQDNTHRLLMCCMMHDAWCMQGRLHSSMMVLDGLMQDDR